MTERERFMQASLGTQPWDRFRFVGKDGQTTDWQPLPPDRNVIPAMRRAQKILGLPIGLDLHRKLSG